jgi:hypothetical protein
MFTLLSLALGSSWHNTWLGIWADFGFPPVIIWAVFWIQALAIGFWCYKHAPPNTPLRTLTFMLLLWFIVTVCRSWTSGHSAEDAFSSWWMFGILVSLKHTTLRSRHVPARRSSLRPDHELGKLAARSP